MTEVMFARLVPQVGGMTCSACCAAVESALNALPGVTNAVLSLIQQQARVEYHANLITSVSTRLSTTSHPDSYSQLSSLCTFQTVPSRHTLIYLHSVMDRRNY